MSAFNKIPTFAGTTWLAANKNRLVVDRDDSYQAKINLNGTVYTFAMTAKGQTLDYSGHTPTTTAATAAQGTIITCGSTWPSYTTAGAAGIKLLLDDACATGNFASIRARAKSSVARTGTLQYTLAGDFSASAAVSEYKDLIGLSSYGQVPAAYTQTNANHIVCGVKAAITDYTGATSSGSRYALWVDDASINTAANGHYLIFAQKLTGAATIDGVMQVRGALFTYGLNFSAATFATADIVFQNSDTLYNSAAGVMAATGLWTFTESLGALASGEKHGVSAATTVGAMTGGTGVVAGNFVATANTAGAGTWLSGVFGKATATAATSPVNGYLSGGEFECTLGGAQNPPAHCAIALNMTDSSTGSANAQNAYVFIRQYGTETRANNLFWFADHTSATGNPAVLISNDSDTAATHYIKCLMGATPLWIMATTTAPAP